jgi:hypothetical protein
VLQQGNDESLGQLKTIERLTRHFFANIREPLIPRPRRSLYRNALSRVLSWVLSPPGLSYYEKASIEAEKSKEIWNFCFVDQSATLRPAQWLEYVKIITSECHQ